MAEANTWDVYRNKVLLWAGVAYCETNALTKAQLWWHDQEVLNDQRPEYEIENILSAVWEAHIQLNPVLDKQRKENFIELVCENADVLLYEEDED